MLSRFSSPLLASLVITGMVSHTATAAVLTDDFDGDAGPLNSATWATSTTAGGSGVMTVDGSSNLIVSPGIPNASQRALVVTKATNFDPFTAPLTITLSDIAVGGTVGTGVWNGGYVLLGRSSTNADSQYIPNGGTMAYGVSVFVHQTASGFKLHVNEFSDNDTDSNPADGTVLYADYLLSAAPTGLTLVIDGANQSLQMTVAGATFTASNTATATQALSANFTAANLSANGELQSRIALGAMNGGTVETASTFTVGAINVVPEPATAGLALAGLLLFAGRARRG